MTPSSSEFLNAALARLDAARGTWATRSAKQKREDLRALLARTHEASADWVTAAIAAKGVPRGSAGEGEEWISGPWALEASIAALVRTLERLEAGQPVLSSGQAHTRPDGQVVVDVFPSTVFDRLLLNGFTTEVWMQPEVSLQNLPEHVAVAFRNPNPAGGLALVLGAGNIASIPPLDVLYELIAENRVAICKLNPVNEYLGPIFERVFAPLIEAGFVAFVYGGAEVGSQLVNDARVTKVHITGSAQSHDAIVFGRGEEGAQRKARKEPLLKKPITSELGGVGPTIVVPGPWSDDDLRFQAAHVATQKMHNGGFNCIAAQVLVLHQEWPLKDRFLELLKETVSALPSRPAYYPGAADRQTAAAQHHPQAEKLGTDGPRFRLPAIDAASPAYAFQNEFFSAAWAETSISAPDAASFLGAAVTFANEKLMGTLGAQLLIHPETARALGPRLEQAIADLRYGTIGVNAWCGVGFLIPTAAWGAFPGHPLEDIQSGRGVVHNALLLEKTQKTVVRAPFSPFPRALFNGELHMSPMPPWFVTNKHAATLGRLLADFEANPSFLKLPAIFAQALTA